MRNITTLLILIIFFNCKAQNPILPLKQWSKEQTNAYYKDLDNELDDFVGTWLYTNGTKSLEIILKKEEMYHYNGRYYRDLIVGEYKYIENGIEKINTLSNINIVNGFQHELNGSSIYINCNYLPTSDCIDGENRLKIILSDPLTGHQADALFHKRTVNGQPALRAYIIFKQLSSYNGYDTPKPEPTMPWQQEYLLIKQD